MATKHPLGKRPRGDSGPLAAGGGSEGGAGGASDGGGVELLDRQDFISMNREMHEADEMREQIIKRSREVLKASKQAIFALHRNNGTEAEKLMERAEEIGTELVQLTTANPTLREGALSAAFEEFVEAKCFWYYLETGRLISRRQLPPAIQKHEYLGGVIDFTGELMRYAVVKATARDVAAVEQCRAIVDAISGELIQFDFRNGSLRRKFDSIKYNLRKLENTLYELSLVTSTGVALQANSTEEIPTASGDKADEEE